MIDFPTRFDPTALKAPHGPDCPCSLCDVGRAAIGHVPLDELARRRQRDRLLTVVRISRGEP